MPDDVGSNSGICMRKMRSTERMTHVSLPSRAGVAAWLRNAVPGTKAAVRYLDGEVDHERLVSLLQWFVVSQDDDRWIKDLSACPVRDEPSVVECLVRYEREAGEPRFYWFRDDTSRERLPRPSVVREPNGTRIIRGLRRR